jgi:2-polyprenyl-3-methyl-5-hydroxy-6-metoxy-1,4-benzoquinol methylase
VIRKILDIPIVYSTFQRTVKTPRYEFMLTQLLGPYQAEGLRILDFGCGPGDLLERFSGADYLGIDPLEGCVKAVQSKLQKLSISGEVKLGDHNSLLNLEPASFDLIIAIGVLHHMPDSDAQTFLSYAARLLKVETGRLVTLDPCLFDNQSLASRFMVQRDRGRFVRHQDEYQALAQIDYREITLNQHSKILRMPYDLLSMILKNS